VLVSIRRQGLKLGPLGVSNASAGFIEQRIQKSAVRKSRIERSGAKKQYVTSSYG